MTELQATDPLVSGGEAAGVTATGRPQSLGGYLLLNGAGQVQTTPGDPSSSGSQLIHFTLVTGR